MVADLVNGRLSLRMVGSLACEAQQKALFLCIYVYNKKIVLLGLRLWTDLGSCYCLLSLF